MRNVVTEVTIRAATPLVAMLAAIWIDPRTAIGQAPDGRGGMEVTEVTEREAAAAFSQAAVVLKHPRCLNCHPSGDRPTQGADMHVHVMNVQRGPDDHGAAGQGCEACHGDANYAPSGVPGAPRWGLAPRSMAWVGLSDRELCEQLKDPSRNGGKTLEEIADHSAHDPLVAWGWAPGEGREPVPGTQAAFGELISTWAEGGGACPPAGAQVH